MPTVGQVRQWLETVPDDGKVLFFVDGRPATVEEAWANRDDNTYTIALTTGGT